MKLIKTTFFSAITTFIRVTTGFVASKVLAIYTGPAGLALIGAFTNFITIVLTFANGAINTGVVKYTAEYSDDEEKLKALFSTALKISVVCSAVIGLLLIVIGPFISTWLFTSEIYANPVRVLGLTIILYSLNSLLISILNGSGQIKTYTIVNAAGSIIGLMFTVILAFYYKIEGALYALVSAQSVVFFVTVIIIMRKPWFSQNYFRKAFDKVIAFKLSHYTLMAVVSALTVPVSQIILRNILVDKIGIEGAGYWQGMVRISDGYLMLITTSLGTYYLPKLSSLKTDEELRTEIIRGYKIILPVVFAGSCSIYFLRFHIISTLYTPAFVQMESLFLWQLIGDFLKMASWVLAFLMLAKSMTRMYLITEVLFSISYVIVGYLFVSMFHLRGVTIAFSLNYFIYFITMMVIFRKLIFGKINHG